MQKRVEEKKKELEKNKEESPNFTTTTTGLKYENLNVSRDQHSSSIRTPRNHRYFEKVYFLNILNTVTIFNFRPLPYVHFTVTNQPRLLLICSILFRKEEWSSTLAVGELPTPCRESPLLLSCQGRLRPNLPPRYSALEPVTLTNTVGLFSPSCFSVSTSCIGWSICP